MSAANTSSDQKTRHISDLVVLGLYLCLISCNYTKCTGYCRTVKFRILVDSVFFSGDTLLPTNTPIRWFKHVTHIVLALDNHKISIQGETVSHFRLDCLEACPVRAGVTIFFRLDEHGCDPTATVSDKQIKVQPWGPARCRFEPRVRQFFFPTYHESKRKGPQTPLPTPLGEILFG